MTTANNRPESRRVGAVRPSQLMYTFGVGACVDLPNLSVIISGIDSWDETKQRAITETRLLKAVQADPHLGTGVRELRTAPWEPETRNPFEDWARTGVPVFPFPRWLRCTACDRIAPIDDVGFFTLDTNPYRPDWAQFRHTNCNKKRGKPPTALPVRFIVACPAGHLDEFPWVEFAHYHGEICDRPLLYAIDQRTGTRSTSMTIKCANCDVKPFGAQGAFGSNADQVLPQCRGRHPHLRWFDPNGCSNQVRAMLLGASNAWFPVTKSALSIPIVGDQLAQLIEDNWSDLDWIEDRGDLESEMRRIRRRPGHLTPLTDYDEDTVWAVIDQRLNGEPTEADIDLITPEWEVFTSPDLPTKANDFELNDVAVPQPYSNSVERVLRIERIREVVAMLGFTRVDGPDSGVTDDAPDITPAPISLTRPEWVPASEVKGEGIFIQLPEAAVQEWVDANAGSAQVTAVDEAHRRWRERRGLDPAQNWPGARYILLHSIAHMLINELALEAGYAAASIRERIYCEDPGGNRPAMAGILLYTAAPDSEGTLGGLVSRAEPEALGSTIARALDRSSLCSSDPHCAEHLPGPDEDTLHAAACHACLFLPETSCERGNRFLDRTALNDTITNTGFGYFAP